MGVEANLLMQIRNTGRSGRRRVATRGLWATDHVILNHGQVTWVTPELAPPEKKSESPEIDSRLEWKADYPFCFMLGSSLSRECYLYSGWASSPTTFDLANMRTLETQWLSDPFSLYVPTREDGGEESISRVVIKSSSNLKNVSNSKAFDTSGSQRDGGRVFPLPSLQTFNIFSFETLFKSQTSKRRFFPIKPKEPAPIDWDSRARNKGREQQTEEEVCRGLSRRLSIDIDPNTGLAKVRKSSHTPIDNARILTGR
ncbi:hypothetical protein TNCV_454571 [Trichonephila clavipes]|nr:hypothetical protein TNCV_454571 [Trichonephila clavipes]